MVFAAFLAPPAIALAKVTAVSVAAKCGAILVAGGTAYVCARMSGLGKRHAEPSIDEFYTRAYKETRAREDARQDARRNAAAGG